MEAMTMNPNDSGYDRSNVPDSSWPDGTPVSNWSHAVAAIVFAGAQPRREHEDGGADNR
jgi:hypothetical protein